MSYAQLTFFLITWPITKIYFLKWISNFYFVWLWSYLTNVQWINSSITNVAGQKQTTIIACQKPIATWQNPAIIAC